MLQLHRYVPLENCAEQECDAPPQARNGAMVVAFRRAEEGQGACQREADAPDQATESTVSVSHVQ